MPGTSAPGQTAVAALPQQFVPVTGPASPSQAIQSIVMNFGTGTRHIEVQGY